MSNMAAGTVSIRPEDSVTTKQLLERTAGSFSTFGSPQVRVHSEIGVPDVVLDHRRFSASNATAISVDDFRLSLDGLDKADVQLAIREEHEDLLGIHLNGHLHAYFAGPDADLAACDPSVEHLVLYGRAGGPGMESLRKLRSVRVFHPPENVVGKDWQCFETLRRIEVVSRLPVALYVMKASRLQELSLATPLTRLNGLGKFAELRNLRLFRCDAIEDLSFLQELPQLRSLVLMGVKEVHSLDILAELPELLDLEISRTDRILESLPADLHRLSIGIDEVESLDGLERYEKLEHLSISECRSLSDIGAIESLPNLRSLFISEASGLASFEPIASLSALEHLTCEYRTRVEKLNWLSGLPRLRSLEVHDANRLDSLDGLAACGDLEHLLLARLSRARSLSGVAALESLRSLQISDYGSFFRAADLGSKPALEYLEISMCFFFASLDGIGSAPSLRYLHVSQCPVSDLSLAASLKSIEVIDVYSAGVTDMSPLVSCTSLRTLRLAAVPLENVDAAAQLRKLVYFEVGNDPFLHSIGPLAEHPSLRALYLWQNTHLREIGPAASIPGLQELSVHHSSGIEDELVLRYLQSRQVTVFGYPIKDPNARPLSQSEIDAILTPSEPPPDPAERQTTWAERFLSCFREDFRRLPADRRPAAVDLLFTISRCDHDIPHPDSRDQALQHYLSNAYTALWNVLPGGADQMKRVLFSSEALDPDELERSLRDLVSRLAQPEPRMHGALVAAFLLGLAEGVNRPALAHVLAQPMGDWVSAEIPAPADAKLQMDDIDLKDYRASDPEMSYSPHAHGFYGHSDGPVFQQSLKNREHFYYIDRYFALRRFDASSGDSTTVQELAGPITNALRHELNETRAVADVRHFWFDEEDDRIYVSAGEFGERRLQCLKVSSRELLREIVVSQVQTLHPLPEGGVRVFLAPPDRCAIDMDASGVLSRYELPVDGWIHAPRPNRLGEFHVYYTDTAVAFMGDRSGEIVEHTLTTSDEWIQSLRLDGGQVAAITSVGRYLRLLPVGGDPRNGVEVRESRVPPGTILLSDGRALRMDLQGSILESAPARLFIVDDPEAEIREGGPAKPILEIEETEDVSVSEPAGGILLVASYLINSTDVYYGSPEYLAGPVPVQEYPGKAPGLLSDPQSGYRLGILSFEPIRAQLEDEAGTELGRFEVPSIHELIGIDAHAGRVLMLRGTKMATTMDASELPDGRACSYDLKSGSLRDEDLPYTGLTMSSPLDSSGVVIAFGRSLPPIFLRAEPSMRAPEDERYLGAREGYSYAYDAAARRLVVHCRGVHVIDLTAGTAIERFPFNTLASGHVKMFSRIDPIAERVFVFDLDHGVFAYNYRTGEQVWAQTHVSVTEPQFTKLVRRRGRLLILLLSRTGLVMIDADTGAILVSYSWPATELSTVPVTVISGEELALYDEPAEYRLPLPNQLRPDSGSPPKP